MRTKIVLLNIAVVALLSMFTLSADAGSNKDTAQKTVSVALGKAETVDLPGSVVDILVADPAVADVGALRSNRLYIVGRSAGDTNVLAFSSSGEVLARVEVHVHVDQKTLQDALKEFFPDEDVQARTINEDIIMTGKVSNPAIANQVIDLANRFTQTEGQTVVNMMTVQGEQQVMLKVHIVEANRAVLRELGMEADYRDVAGVLSTNSASFNTLGGAGLTADPFSIFSVVVDSGGFGPLELTLRALERDGLVNTLAEPNLTAISGETAGFLAGGEFPVPTGTDDDGNIVIEFKQFGVALNFKPIVMNAERISLQLSTEVSALADQDGITLNSIEIPGLSVRRAQTTVEMGSGNTLMIAGLIQSKTVEALNGLPGITDIPVLGELFKSRSFEQNESELIVMVTPYLVRPFAKAEAVRKADTPPVTMAPVVPVATVPQKTQTPLPAPVQGDHLSSRFVSNLRQVYGAKVPSGLTSDPKISYGYILD